MSSVDPRIKAVEDLIELTPDFPIPGLLFKNLFPVLRDAKVFKGLIDVMVEDIKDKHPDVEVIAGLDSRGFLFGPLIAQALSIAFVPVRKKGKLPGETFRMDYDMDYGKDSCEIQKNSIKPGQKVVIVDDLLATGGTMKAACDLMEAAGANILACMTVIGIRSFEGAARLKYPFISYIA